jgi:aspartyl-tRNA(Asn)/glutamyl-tRNA(Gln) amidotransferase subunit B
MYVDACDGNMEEGSLRCDANVSLRRPGDPLGTRAEVKNLNSFRYLARAVEYEIARQTALLEAGERIVQETRLFDPAANETRSMRSKEEAHDYRYFDEPDLPPLLVGAAWVDEVRRSLPRLPDVRSHGYEHDWQVPAADAVALAATRQLAEFFEAVVAESHNPRLSANWVRNEVLRVLNDRRIAFEDYLVTPAMLGRLIGMVESGAIGGKSAKEVFDEMSGSGEAPEAIVERRGLAQITDPAIIREAAERVIASSAGQVAAYRNGKPQLFGFFVGQLMKATGGKAKAELANEIMREMLEG